MLKRITARLAILVVLVVTTGPISQASNDFARVDTGPVVSDGGWSFAASWVDYDGDNYPDLYVNNNDFGSTGEVNFLYHNNGDGTYTRVEDGVVSSEGGSVASTWADFDNDGDNDVYVSCFNTYNYFYLNDGDGTFTKVSTGPLGTLEDGTMEAEWVDCNNDGMTDLFVVNHYPGGPTSIQCALYMNTGDSLSLQDNLAIGLLDDEGNGTAWGDYDNDGDRDVFWSRNDNLTLFFDNDGDGTFTQNTAIAIVQPPAKYHGNWADYDNDGDLDLYTLSGYPGTPHLLENTADGDFALVTGQQIAVDTGYWNGGYWADYDNDGWLDILVLGNEFYQPHPNRLYHNNGDGTFTRETTGPIVSDLKPSSAAAWADHDRDGDLDLFVANVDDADNSLYENLGNANHWLQICLEGTISNRSGIGAGIRLKALISGEPIWQMREISAKNGFMSQGELVAHFGLGDAPVVDSIRIEWPSGVIQILDAVSADQLLTITEPCCGAYTSGSTGNTNCDQQGKLNLSDITTLITRVYLQPDDPLCCEENGDVNCDTKTNLTDITRLITVVYIDAATELCACL